MQKLSESLKAKIAARPTKTILRGTTASTEQEFAQVPKAKEGRTDVIVPDSFNGVRVWRGLLSPIRNQGSCGSCWAFASTSTLADRFNIQSRGLMNVELSPAKLVICDYQGEEWKVAHPELTPEQVGDVAMKTLNSSSCTGNTLYDAWRYLYTIGTNTEKCVPYDETLGQDFKFKSLSKFDKQNQLPICTNIGGRIGDMCTDVSFDEYSGDEYGTPARFYRCIHFYSVAGTEKDGGSEYNIRKDIYTWGPVSTGMVVYPDFYTFDPKKEIYHWNGIGRPVGGHAIELVGWGEENGKKYWIVRNSWGKDWGRGGYFYMSRGNNECNIEENILTGVPDFFYPDDFKIPNPPDFKWAESEISKKRRHTLTYDWSVTGGGIDPTTGYVRRIMATKPWINLDRPFDLKYLIDSSTFIAGIDSAPKKRYTFLRTVRKENPTVYYEDDTAYITLVVIVVLLAMVLYVLYKK